MENIIKNFESDSPYYPAVNFNVSTGICEISGESYMEEAYKFYLPLIDWLKKYTTELRKPITLNFKLTYFNTASSRLILDILDLLKKYSDYGGDVKISWFYDPADPDILDEIEDFEIETGLKIQLKQLNM